MSMIHLQKQINGKFSNKGNSMAEELRKPKILIVDDEPLGVEVLKCLLMHTYEVQVAFDGREGLIIAGQFVPDLVLLDVMMPEMNGYEVFACLKSIEGLCDIPVLFITSLNEIECEAYGLGLGAHDYIIKPFNAALVRLRVHNQLEFKFQRDMLAARTRELEKTLEELRASQEDVKKLAELLPICAGCKKIRDDQGYWKQIEEYLNEHNGMQFSHGLCSDCIERLYPGYYKAHPELFEKKQGK
jgi:response regulator RpfG family c-di-GMP phosphodiesterase